jgi:hypothetical protein
VQSAECEVQSDHTRRRLRVLVSSILSVSAVVLLSACGANRTGSGAECTAIEDNIVVSTSAATLAGEYQLTLVATEGARQSGSESGDLTLLEHNDEDRYFRSTDGSPVPGVIVPLYGTTTVSLDRVGAVKLGDLESTDPMKPGVAVMEHRAEQGSLPDIVLRFGSFANQRDITRFDGGFTALRVKWIQSGNFGGTWESGVMGPEAKGYFCAMRK